MRRTGYSSRRNYINKYKRAERVAEMKKKRSRSVARVSARSFGEGRNFSLLLLTAAAMLLSLLILFGNRAKAESENAGTYSGYYKYFTSITVQPGDTLSAYADTYNIAGIKSNEDYIAEVCTINNIDKDNIISGSRIIIPYYDKEFK